MIGEIRERHYKAERKSLVGKKCCRTKEEKDGERRSGKGDGILLSFESLQNL